MITESFDLPEHWACPLFYGFSEDWGLSADDCCALQAFTDWMVEEYGSCWCVDMGEPAGFVRLHDARRFGVLACDVAPFVFDVTPRGKQ